MKKIIVLSTIAFLNFGLLQAQAADISGSKDYPGIKRYEGSEIVGYKTSSFDEYKLPAIDQSTPNSPMLTYDGSKSFGGATTRILYRVPGAGQHTAFEVFNNYKNALQDAKFEIITEGSADTNLNNFVGKFYIPGQEDQSASNAILSNSYHFLEAKLLNADGKDIYLTLLVEKGDRNLDVFNVWGHNINFTEGDTLALLDLVEVKSMENKMVLVKSSDMADAINKTGKIDIYGIQFDVDKTDIKPESNDTLAQVAKLLQEEVPTLNIQVSGHTDNSGKPEHNMTLSQGRAAAVVNVLVKQYHVDPARLKSAGFGDTKPVAPNDTDANKAKNRRVELSKL